MTVECAVGLAPGPGEVSRARRLTCWQLEAWGLAHLTDRAALLVSELVTNAVVHGGGPTLLRLSFDGTLRVEVTDRSPAPPRLRRTGPDELGGRGLQLVDGLAECWSWQPRGRGKLVWCELRPLPPDRAP
ncbi:MAG: ATP-binding protein [Carbonactinosporaceae bacterium]